MIIKLNESNEIRLRYAVADSKSPDAWDDSFWTKDGTLVDIYSLEQNIDIFDDSKSAENLAHEVLKDIQDSEVFVVSIDEGGTTDFIKRISESKDSQDNLKESNSGTLYAIAYCEDPDIYSEEFWGWDTESDVGYELMEFGSLIQDADVFDSLEAAEDRADDALSSIFEDEVFIVGLDPYTPHNLTGFIKKVTRPTMNENYCVYSSSNDGCYKEFTGTEDECNSWIENNKQRFPTFVNLKIQPESESAKWSRDFDITESKSINETNTNPEDKFLFYFPYTGGPKTLNKERTIRQLEFELDNIKNSSGSGIAGRGFGVYCLESVDPETGTVWTGRHSSKEFLNCLHESKSIKEDISPNTMKEIEWLLDGIINIGPEDKINDQADWKRLYTTASRIRKQLNKEDLDEANLNENYVPEYGDEFPNMNAAMYVARSLVYYFVSNPDDAEKLYAKAESDGWESSELVALCDLIGDALEASNYHSEAKDYFYDKFPYWWAFDVSAEDEAKMDELIESCDDDSQRMQLLIIAVNSLVLELD